ncbi:MAG: glycosyltransferase family 2 protein [Bacteroidota bacterium]
MGNTADCNCILTIIVPLFNEEENFARLAKELSYYRSQANYCIKIIFVNDGSTDTTGLQVERFCTENNSFSFIHLKKNYGLSTALKAGIDQVESKYTGYIDADLQTSPFDFNLLMAYIDSYDLVTGFRSSRMDSLIKRVSSQIANAIRRIVTRDGVSDTCCPLKVFHTDISRQIPFFEGMHRFLPALVLLNGGRVKEVPVRHFKRLAGKSKYHIRNRLFGPAIDLFAFIWMRRRYIRYEITGKG